MELKDKDTLSEAFHLLKEMRAVDTRKGLVRFEAEVLKKKQTKSISFWGVVRNSAAVLIPVLLLINAWFLYNNSASVTISGEALPNKMEIVTMNGTRVMYTLPDSTFVWLRGGSKLVYDTFMKNRKERKVELTGEAYFEVRSDKDNPFIVTMNDLEVKVTGTSFNCNTDFPGRIQVTLEEGEVELRQNTIRGNNLLTSLTPGRHFQYDTKNNTYSVKDVDVRKYTGWKDGYLLFDDDPMADVLERISHWYEVNIEIADKEIKHMRFTAQFNDLKLAQIINILELSSNMTSTYIRGKVDDNGTAMQDRLILRMKK